MIRELQISNFKSVKALDLKCSRINVFIGEPNTGKSNILETIGLLHLFVDQHRNFFDDDILFMLRISQWTQLFHNHDLSQPVSVTADKMRVELRYDDEKKQIDVYTDKEKTISLYPDQLIIIGDHPQSMRFALYRFRKRDKFPFWEAKFVLQPDAPNLMEVIRSRKRLLESLKSLLSKPNLDFVFDLTSRTIRLEWQTPAGERFREALYLPYSALSDALQITIFNLAIVLGNENMVIALEEPETHMSPTHIKKLAELIAHDENGNQYFISTYSPYLLMTLLEKTRKDELNVYLTYLKNRETKVKLLTDKQKEEIHDMGVDIFFNLDKFLEELKEGVT
jgi:AAA15 family ATPase/GTPase